MQALARCYPQLLAFRVARYAQLAHVTLGFHDLRSPDFAVDHFISAIRP